MHGIIYAELKKYIECNYRNGTWDALMEKSGIGPKLYLQSQEYPDAEAMAIITEASKVNGHNVSAVLENFGLYLAPVLLRMYHLLVDPAWKTLDLLEHTEETIHKIVRMRNPGARPPELKCKRESENEITLTYSSPRKMCTLLKGIVQGLAGHYCERICIVENSCTHRSSAACVFSIRKIG